MDFKSPWWMTRLFSMVIAYITSSKYEDPEYIKKEFFLESAGGVTPIYFAHPKSGKSKKLLLVMPGVTGTADDEYIKETVQLFNTNGYSVAVLHPIGTLNESEGRRFSHIFTPEHFNEVIEIIRKETQAEEYYGIGFSLGANHVVRVSLIFITKVRRRKRQQVQAQSCSICVKSLLPGLNRCHAAKDMVRNP